MQCVLFLENLLYYIVVITQQLSWSYLRALLYQFHAEIAIFAAISFKAATIVVNLEKNNYKPKIGCLLECFIKFMI